MLRLTFFILSMLFLGCSEDTLCNRKVNEYVNFECPKTSPDNSYPRKHFSPRPNNVSMQFGKGWLKSYCYGEFGGHLVYEEKKRKVDIKRGINVIDIFRVKDVYVVICASDHLNANYGAYFVVRGVKNSEPQISQIKNLPGYPEVCQFDKNHLWIKCKTKNESTKNIDDYEYFEHYLSIDSNGELKTIKKQIDESRTRKHKLNKDYEI